MFNHSIWMLCIIPEFYIFCGGGGIGRSLINLGNHLVSVLH